MEERQESAQSLAMTEAVYRDCVDFVLRSRAPHLSLLGGEPSLHPNFNQFIKIAQTAGLAVSVKSNALFIKNTDELLSDLNHSKLHFLINLNYPESMGEKKWQRTLDNLEQLSKLSIRVDFQINIADKNFSYDYLWPVMAKFPASKLYWTLTVPIAKAPTQTKSIKPIEAKKYLMERVLEMLTKAQSLGHATCGTHGVTPCLFPTNFLQENKQWHQIAAECVPVFDFYSDYSIHYCFPLEEKKSLKDFRQYPSLQAVQREFLWPASKARPYTFPWKECLPCEHAASGDCHGGCMAAKTWLAEADWQGEHHFKNNVPKLVTPKDKVMAYFPRYGWTSDLKEKNFSHHSMLWNTLIPLIDGKRSYLEIESELKKNFPELLIEPWLELAFSNLMGALMAVFLPKEHRYQISIPK